MATAKQGDTVKVHYTGKLNDNTVFDSSQDSEPLQFTLGEGQVIPGFEHAIEGMLEGESKSITVPAGEAYGPHLEELMMHVSRDKLPEGLRPDIGEHLQVQTTQGMFMIVEVADVSDFEVTLDANHPLAGKDLKFDIELIEVMVGGRRVSGLG